MSVYELLSVLISFGRFIVAVLTFHTKK
ncbi:putative holin-like toxin [Metabacillus sp. RGM 3146]